MSDLISGLLTQKPSSPAPTQGEVGRYEVEVKPKKSGEGTWNKIKNAGGDFGASYKVLKAERKDDYTHPQHGTFHQYSVLLEPATNGSAPVSSSATGNVASADFRHTNKDAEIARAVAFKGAVELTAARVQQGKLEPESVVSEVRILTDSLLGVLTGSAEGKSMDFDPTGPPHPSEIPDSVKEPGDDDIPF